MTLWLLLFAFTEPETYFRLGSHNKSAEVIYLTQNNDLYLLSQAHPSPALHQLPNDPIGSYPDSWIWLTAESKIKNHKTPAFKRSYCVPQQHLLEQLVRIQTPSTDIIYSQDKIHEIITTVPYVAGAVVRMEPSTLSPSSFESNNLKIARIDQNGHYIFPAFYPEKMIWELSNIMTGEGLPLGFAYAGQQYQWLVGFTDIGYRSLWAMARKKQRWKWKSQKNTSLPMLELPSNSKLIMTHNGLHDELWLLFQKRHQLMIYKFSGKKWKKITIQTGQEGILNYNSITQQMEFWWINNSNLWSWTLP